MNQRIKSLIELAEYQAQKQLGSTWEYHVEPSREQIFEKFAELIVRECLSVGEDVANANSNGPWFDGYVSGVEEVNRRIKQHFGVEE